MPWNRADQLVERADDLSFDGNYEAAEKLIEEALSLAPNLAGAHAVQAVNHLRQERIESAQSSIETALNFDPNDVFVRYAAGLVATTRIDYREAEKHFREGIALDNEYIFNFLGLAELFQTEEKLQKALNIIDEAKKIEPENVSVAVVRANILVELGRTKEGAQEARIALSLDPNEINCNVVMAEIELIRGNITSAKEHAVYALMKNPRYHHAKLMLAQIVASENVLLQVWWRYYRIVRRLPLSARYILIGLVGGIAPSLRILLDSSDASLQQMGYVATTLYVSFLIFAFSGFLANEWLINRALRETKISADF